MESFAVLESEAGDHARAEILWRQLVTMGESEFVGPNTTLVDYWIEIAAACLQQEKTADADFAIARAASLKSKVDAQFHDEGELPASGLQYEFSAMLNRAVRDAIPSR